MGDAGAGESENEFDEACIAVGERRPGVAGGRTGRGILHVPVRRWRYAAAVQQRARHSADLPAEHLPESRARRSRRSILWRSRHPARRPAGRRASAIPLETVAGSRRAS